MDNRSLSYDTLKSILKHLDPNLRLKVGQQVPSLRKTEKVVPLKLDVLDFKPTGLTVNDTEYVFTLHIEPHKDSPDALNAWIRSRNMGEFSGEDLNEFGVPDFSGNELTAGDIVLDQVTWLEKIEQDSQFDDRFERLVNDLASEQETIKQYSEKVRKMSAYLEKIRKKKEDGKPLTGKEKRNIEDCEDYKEIYSNSILGREAWIDSVLEDYPTYCYYRDKVKPPYDALLQLVMKKSSGTEIVRKPYNQKIHEVTKKLIIDLLGARRHVIDVNSLRISSATVLRLPENVKFRVQEIVIRGILTPLNAQLNVLSCIIDESSFPLECLKVDFITRNTNDIAESLKNPIVQNSKRLVIKGDVEDSEEWLPILTELKNKSVSFILNDIGIVNHIQFIQSWLETGREVGSSFVFSIYNEGKFVDLLSWVEETFNQNFSRERCIYLPMNNSSHLRIMYEINDDWHGMIMGTVSDASQQVGKLQKHSEYMELESVETPEESESGSLYNPESAESEFGSDSEAKEFDEFEEYEDKESGDLKLCSAEPEFKPEDLEAPKPENSSFGGWLFGKLSNCLRRK